MPEKSPQHAAASPATKPAAAEDKDRLGGATRMRDEE
jgi:hypothetical protein